MRRHMLWITVLALFLLCLPQTSRTLESWHRSAPPTGSQAHVPVPDIPCTIRVAVRPIPQGQSEPARSGPYVVEKVEMAEYVVRVLAHEFGDFTDEDGSHRFTAEPLKAGAMAIMMYAWAYSLTPAAPDYDVDNSRSFQVYIPDKPYDLRYLGAVRTVWGTYMVRQTSGHLFAPQHGAGWYNGRSQGTDWMNQRGALYLADTRGYSWEQILRYYYRHIDLRRHPSPCAGP